MAKRILQGLGALLVLAVLGALAVGVVARFHDGPLGPFPGGAFSGTPSPVPPESWAFLADAPTVALQVGREEPRTVTTWVVVHESGLYVPSGMASQKTWPEVAAREGRVLLRTPEARGGWRLFALAAERVTDPELRQALGRELSAKYEVGLPGEEGDTWWFRLGPPVEPREGAPAGRAAGASQDAQ